jgi:hypothetical protein
MGVYEAGLSSGAEFTTYFDWPAGHILRPFAIEKPSLRRSRLGTRNAVGLEELIAAYLRWAVAESSNALADLARRRVRSLLESWIVELVCGEPWSRRESDITVVSLDPWALLARRCSGLRFWWPLETPLNDKEARSLVRLALARLRRVHSGFWACAEDLDDDDCAQADSAFTAALEELANERRRLGEEDLAEELDDSDLGTTVDDWTPVLDAIRSDAALIPLGELLIPTDQAGRLVALDFSVMSSGDLTEELWRWARNSKAALAGSVPSRPTLEAIMSLWLAPEQAITKDWRGAIDTLLAERCIARAARYLALRGRHALRGGGA